MLLEDRLVGIVSLGQPRSGEHSATLVARLNCIFWVGVSVIYFVSAYIRAAPPKYNTGDADTS